MPKMCNSTLLWGALLSAIIIANTVMMQNIPFTTVSIMATFLTLYTVQCLCVGGCWMLSWFHPITYPAIIILLFIATIATLSISMESIKAKFFSAAPSPSPSPPTTQTTTETSTATQGPTQTAIPTA